LGSSGLLYASDSSSSHPMWGLFTWGVTGHRMDGSGYLVSNQDEIWFL